MNMQAKKTILLVEDEVLIALAEAQTIEGFGYRVLTANTGEKAVVIATGDDKPDLILMDIDLGKGISGPDAAAEILSKNAIPIVFLTSHAERDMVEKVRGITRYGYVIKNSGDFVLQSSIEMAFELHSANELLKGELTERRRTEDRLAHSHQLMQYVIQHSRSAIAVHDTAMTYIYVSQRYLDDYKVKEKDVIGKHHYEVFPDLPEKWREVHRLALAGKVSSAEDDPYERDDGSVEWTRWECRPWYEADGSIGGIIVYTEVITQRKKTEEELRKSEARYRGMFESVQDIYYETTIDGTLLEVSPSVGTASRGQYQRNDLLGTSIHDLYAFPGGREALLSVLQKQGTLSDYEVMLKNRDGSHVPCSISAHLHRDARGIPTKIVGSVRDITERKKAQEALQREKLMLSRTEGIAKIGSWVWEIATDTVTWSDELFHIFQRNPREGAPSFAEHPAFYHPDDMASLQKAVATAIADGTPYELELRAIRKDGETRLCVARGIAERGPDGRMARLLGSFQDITERKQAEERLKDERNLLMTIINAIPDEIAVKDLERRFLLVNPPCIRALGKSSPDEVVGKRDEDLIAREFVEVSKAEEERLLMTGIPVLNAEGRPRLDPITGEIQRALLVSRSPMRDRHGAIAGLVVISRDITERKRTEDTSHTLEHQFRLVWEKSTDGMRLTNEDGTILRVNEAFCRMVGKERSELETHSLAVVYEKGRQAHVARRHQERFRSRTVEGHFEREVTLWDGRTMWVEVSNSFLDFAGQPSLLLGIFHDITERKRSEARIEALFAEREVLLKEVHHRIKNNMHTMMSLLSLQARSMTDPGAVAAVNDARSRMQSMMVLYDKLYRSEGFKELPIKEYLVPLVGEIVENLPNAGMVTIETHVEDFILQAKLLSPLGIIVNELLSNAMKYAFTGLERGTITIAASLREHRATLVVQDDGIGLPAVLDLKTSTGFGLRLVDMLTEQMGGTMRIERNNGTRFILEFEV